MGEGRINKRGAAVMRDLWTGRRVKVGRCWAGSKKLSIGQLSLPGRAGRKQSTRRQRAPTLEQCSSQQARATAGSRSTSAMGQVKTCTKASATATATATTEACACPAQLRISRNVALTEHAYIQGHISLCSKNHLRSTSFSLGVSCRLVALTPQSTYFHAIAFTQGPRQSSCGTPAVCGTAPGRFHTWRRVASSAPRPCPA